MKKTLCLAVIVSLFLFSGCHHDDVIRETDTSLPGTWLLVEQGYSDGATYFTQSVPPFPPQTVTFHGDNTVRATFRGFSDFGFYRMWVDTTYHENVVTFYNYDPNLVDSKGDSMDYSYVIDSDDRSLKLYYRWCVEGCHLKFKRM